MGLDGSNPTSQTRGDASELEGLDPFGSVKYLDTITLEDFIEDHLIPRSATGFRPQAIGILAVRKLDESLLGRGPNFAYLKAQFGGARVSVTDCATTEFNSTRVNVMSVSSFVEAWERIEAIPSDRVRLDGSSLLPFARFFYYGCWVSLQAWFLLRRVTESISELNLLLGFEVDVDA
ncbi:hypothetical protein L0F63_005402 [Massospora cicadina]|nr:hypothetical protein L0F63_005402 [Massospora cicadina]